MQWFPIQNHMKESVTEKWKNEVENLSRNSVRRDLVTKHSIPISDKNLKYVKS